MYSQSLHPIEFQAIKLKAKGLAQNGGPTGWRDPAGVILYVKDGPYTTCPFRPNRLPWQELLSCELTKFPAAVL